MRAAYVTQFVAALYVSLVPFGTIILLRYSAVKVLLAIVGGVVGNIVIITSLAPPPILNAALPIEVTLLGIVILLRDVQALNAPLLIEVTLSGIVILARRPQAKNATPPIEVTPLPIVMFVRFAQR